MTTSPESVFLGVPVALWGLLFFTGMTVLTAPPAYRLPWLHRIRIGTLGVGVVFVIYLVYAELFTIDALCLWCTAIHVITVALFVAVLLIDHRGLPARRARLER